MENFIRFTGFFLKFKTMYFPKEYKKLIYKHLYIQ